MNWKCSLCHFIDITQYLFVVYKHNYKSSSRFFMQIHYIWINMKTILKHIPLNINLNRVSHLTFCIYLTVSGSLFELWIHFESVLFLLFNQTSVTDWHLIVMYGMYLQNYSESFITINMTIPQHLSFVFRPKHV